MGSIQHRRAQLEQRVPEGERSNQYPLNIVGADWICEFGGAQTPTRYRKEWGNLGMLDIKAFIPSVWDIFIDHQPRSAYEFGVDLRDSPDHGNLETYILKEPALNSPFPDACYSSHAWMLPDRVPGLETRPLTVDEINEVYDIFQQELANFMGDGPIDKTVRFFALRWSERFIRTALEQLKDQALERNASDWADYEQRRERVASYR